MASVSLTVAQVMLTVDTKHSRVSTRTEVELGKPQAAELGPVPRQRTGHYVLIISSFLTPK